MQRLRLELVTTGDRDGIPIVASERWVPGTALPPVYDRLADVVGAPITFEGHPGGLWGLSS